MTQIENPPRSSPQPPHTPLACAREEVAPHAERVDEVAGDEGATEGALTWTVEGGFNVYEPPTWHRELFSGAGVDADNWGLRAMRLVGPVQFSWEAKVYGYQHAEVTVWSVRGGGGVFVEIRQSGDIVEWVHVPLRADWLPFLKEYILPFIQAFSQVATSDALDRLSAAFIAKSRHGEGTHIDELEGFSRHDKKR